MGRTVSYSVVKRNTRTEIDTRFSNHRHIIRILRFRTSSAQTYLESAQIGKPYDLAPFQSLHNHILQGNKHSHNIRTRHRTGFLNTIRHFANLYMAISLSLCIKLRHCILIKRIITLYHRMRRTAVYDKDSCCTGSSQTWQ